VLVTEPLEIPLRGVLMLPWTAFVTGEDLVENWDEQIELLPENQSGATVCSPRQAYC
jgi:hypothetical protein